MSWSAYITGEGGLIAQYDKIACGGIFGQNGSTFAQAQLDHVQTNYTEIISLVNLITIRPLATKKVSHSTSIPLPYYVLKRVKFFMQRAKVRAPCSQ